MRLTYQYQLSMVKADKVLYSESEEIDPIERIEASLNVINTVIQYLKTVLPLNKDQINRLDNLDHFQTVMLANRLVRAMLGISESDSQEVEEADGEEKK